MGEHSEALASVSGVKDRIPMEMMVLRRVVLGIGLLFRFGLLLFGTIPIEERYIALVLLGNGFFLPLRQFSVISLLHVLEFGR